MRISLLSWILFSAACIKRDAGEKSGANSRDNGDAASDADTDADADADTDSDTAAPLDADADGYDDTTDCNDADAAIHPNAGETRGNGKDDDCNGYIDEIVVPNVYPTIQGGIDAAVDGETVLVRAGTYPENLTISGVGLTLVGADGAERTIVDAAGKHRSALDVGDTSGQSVTVRGIWFANGSSDSGGGVSCHDGGGPLNLENVFVTGGAATYSGGGIGLNECAVTTMTRVVIAENEASGGGGLGVYGTDVVATNVLLLSNTAATGGGGVLINEGNAAFTQVTVLGNDAGATGGGMSLSPGAGHLVTLSSSILMDNSAGASTMAITANGAGSTSIAYSDIDGTTYGVTFADGADGNLTADPLFVNWTRGSLWSTQDLHLQRITDGFTADSPCIDAGDPSDTDADGTRADMGDYGGGESP